jgi:hypothetical protein
VLFVIDSWVSREAMSDPQVLAFGRAEHRAVVTDNLRDYRPLHNEAIVPGGDGHFGMIFTPGTYRRTKADIGRIIAALRQSSPSTRARATSLTGKPGSNERVR